MASQPLQPPSNSHFALLSDEGENPQSSPQGVENPHSLPPTSSTPHLAPQFPEPELWQPEFDFPDETRPDDFLLDEPFPLDPNGNSRQSTTFSYHNILDATPCNEAGDDLPEGSILPSSHGGRTTADWAPYNNRIEFELAEFLYKRNQMPMAQIDT
ncbi:hypothetical protein BD779DRAFT_1673875 [Infundibulicybe gibba]|nr:hypothetical protein BD779DRAFT_1673875 [Infundibulicybe gibba]